MRAVLCILLASACVASASSLIQGGGKRLWTQYGDNLSIFDAPIAGNGNVFFTSGNIVHAYNAQTGKLAWEWTAPTIGGIVTPVLSPNQKVLYVARRSYSTRVYAIDTSSGEQLWQTSSYQRIALLGGPLAVSPDGNTVFASAQRSTAGIYAYEAQTGDLRWKLTVSPDTPFTYAVSVSKDSQVAYAVSNGKNDTAYALNVKSGKVLWKRFAGSGPGGQSLSIDGTRLYVNGLALNVKNGRTKWASSMPFNGDSASLLQNPNGKIIYSIINAFNGASKLSIVALDASKGTLMWRFKAGTGTDSFPILPVMNKAGTLLYRGSSDGFISCINAYSGKLVFRTAKSYFHSGYGQAILSKSEKTLYVTLGGKSDLTPGVLALNAETGVEMWTVNTGRSSHGYPLMKYMSADMGNNMLLVPTPRNSWDNPSIWTLAAISMDA